MSTVTVVVETGTCNPVAMALLVSCICRAVGKTVGVQTLFSQAIASGLGYLT